MLNSITYIIYLGLSIFVTVFVSRTLSKNGLPFLVRGFKGDEELAASINHLLVVGFYLVNLGFVLLKMKTGVDIDGIEQLHHLPGFGHRRGPVRPWPGALLQHVRDPSARAERHPVRKPGGCGAGPPDEQVSTASRAAADSGAAPLLSDVTVRLRTSGQRKKRHATRVGAGPVVNRPICTTQNGP